MPQANQHQTQFNGNTISFPTNDLINKQNKTKKQNQQTRRQCIGNIFSHSIHFIWCWLRVERSMAFIVSISSKHSEVYGSDELVNLLKKKTF